MAAGGAVAGAAAAAIANAIKASGVIVQLSPEEFERILERQKTPLVVYAEGGVFRTSFRYLTSYKGLAFFTKSPKPLVLLDAEVVRAQKIWIPG